MELRSLTDYMNINFTLLRGNTTIDREHISEEDKEYLLSTFPEWFVETSVAEEAAIETERLRVEEILRANAAGEEVSSNPFEADPIKTTDVSKDVDYIENQESKVEISSNDAKVKNKKK